MNKLKSEKEILKNKEKLRKGSYVYFLTREDKIVYVGQTVNGLQRVYAHMFSKDFDGYHLIECEKENLDELESMYILKFAPKYNKGLNLPKEYIVRDDIRKVLKIDGFLLNRIKKIYGVKPIENKVNNKEYYVRKEIKEYLQKYIHEGRSYMFDGNRHKIGVR